MIESRAGHRTQLIIRAVSEPRRLIRPRPGGDVEHAAFAVTPREPDRPHKRLVQLSSHVSGDDRDGMVVDWQLV